MNDQNSEIWTDEDEAGAEAHDSVLEAFEEAADGGKEVSSPTRITEDLAGRVGRWSGVNSCCNSGIAMGNLRPHFDSWVAATLAANPGSSMIASGWYEGQIKCKTKRPPLGARSCKGWFTKIVCYVDIV
jgi:hypothetical protein